MPKLAGVYFVQMGDHIKICVSTDVRKRMVKLGTGASTPLRVLGVMVDATEIQERALHARFSAHHSNGEWFHAAPEILVEAARWPHQSDPSVRRAGRGRPEIGPRVTMVLPPEIIDGLDARAAADGLKRAEVVRRACVAYLRGGQ